MLVYDYYAHHAIREIYDSFGDVVKIKPKSLLKFGRTENADDGAKTTVMELPGATQRHETYISDNLIDTISSGSTNDTDIEVYIEGNTIENNQFSFVTQNVQLNGQNKVLLSTPLARCTRLINVTGEDGAIIIPEAAAKSITGPVYIYEDTAIVSGAPTDDTKVHLYVSAGGQQSQKASTTMDNTEYGVVTGLIGSINRETASASDVDVELEIRNFGGVFAPKIQPITLRTAATSSISIEFKPHIVVPKNADIRVVATASANDTFVTAGFTALFAEVQT